MENHPIPQDVTGFKFRLIGSMTVKQFLYVLGGGGLALFVFILPMSFYLRLPLSLFFAGFGAALAFIPIEGRPMDVMVKNFLKALPAENQYIYRKKGAETLILNYFSPPTKAVVDPAKSTEEEEELKRKRTLLKKELKIAKRYNPDKDELLKIKSIDAYFGDADIKNVPEVVRKAPKIINADAIPDETGSKNAQDFKLDDYKLQIVKPSVANSPKPTEAINKQANQITQQPIPTLSPDDKNFALNQYKTDEELKIKEVTRNLKDEAAKKELESKIQSQPPSSINEPLIEKQLDINVNIATTTPSSVNPVGPQNVQAGNLPNTTPPQPAQNINTTNSTTQSATSPQPNQIVNTEEEKLAQDLKLAEEKLQHKRLEEERLTKEKEDAEKKLKAFEEAKKAAEAKRLEEEKLAKEREEARRIEEERKEKERIAAEQKARLEAIAKKQEEERLAREKAEAEARAKKLEEERKALEQKKLEEQARIEAEKKAAAEAEARRLEEERLAQERARIEAEKRAIEEAKKLMEERLAREKAELESKILEEERLLKEKEEAARVEAEKKAMIEAEVKKLEEEKKAREKAELEAKKLQAEKEEKAKKEALAIAMARKMEEEDLGKAKNATITVQDPTKEKTETHSAVLIEKQLSKNQSQNSIVGPTVNSRVEKPDAEISKELQSIIDESIAQMSNPTTPMINKNSAIDSPAISPSQPPINISPTHAPNPIITPQNRNANKDLSSQQVQASHIPTNPMPSPAQNLPKDNVSQNSMGAATQHPTTATSDNQTVKTPASDTEVYAEQLPNDVQRFFDEANRKDVSQPQTNSSHTPTNPNNSYGAVNNDEAFQKALEQLNSIPYTPPSTAPIVKIEKTVYPKVPPKFDEDPKQEIEQVKEVVRAPITPISTDSQEFKTPSSPVSLTPEKPKEIEQKPFIQTIQPPQTQPEHTQPIQQRQFAAPQPLKRSFEVTKPGESTTVKSIAKSDLLNAGFPQLPDVPNIVLGIIKDPRGKVIPNILVEILDSKGIPVRAFKTNGVGQFTAATPLANGEYDVVIDDTRKLNEFENIHIKLDGSIFQPLEITSIDAREKLRRELFGGQPQQAVQ